MITMISSVLFGSRVGTLRERLDEGTSGACRRRHRDSLRHHARRGCPTILVDVARGALRDRRSMRRDITQQELHGDSDEILRRVEAGETFTITRNGQPVAELTPLHPRRFPHAVNVLAAFRDCPPVDLDSLRADLDAVSDPDPTPRG